MSDGANGGSGSRGRLWAALPAVLLVSLIGTQLIVLAGVLDDPAHAVESDYYDKAVHWDAWRAQRDENRRLGWQAQASLRAVSAGAAAPGAPSTGARVEVVLTDGQGAPVEAARVSLEAFHNARAARVLRADLEERAPGHYQALIPARRPGLWELRLEAQRADARYTEVVRRDLRSAR